MQRPTEEQIIDAREIIANPQFHSAMPSTFQAAWEILKNARGQSVNFGRIGSAHYEIGADPLLAPCISLVHGKPACACPLAYLTKGGDAA
ncbi:hypothetical protein Q8W25_17780 [Shimia thalassica]|uniref:hypothetical protein n=1 Tax=Shimia thalassica TaxID=1715693 RepID=UPI002733552E|nr:hypothetical protein [Shimia thalassica]MDP2495883.1 hypothetical protein [Shimia thalassica]